jgi:AcrR family transcriptional regulator
MASQTIDEWQDRRKGRRASGRGRRLEREERQIEILDAAYKLFAKKGYGATRIDDIAKQANVAKGLITFYFKSKENVFQAVVRRAIPVLLDKLETNQLEDYKSASLMLRDAIGQVYHHLVENPQAGVILQLLIAEGRSFPKLKAFYHSEVVQRGNAEIARIVELGVKRGEFDIELDDNTTRVLLGPIISALFWQILFVDFEKIDAERFIESHIEIVLHGLVGSRRSRTGTRKK